jgi:hypothetical protein
MAQNRIADQAVPMDKLGCLVVDFGEALVAHGVGIVRLTQEIEPLARIRAKAGTG